MLGGILVFTINHCNPFFNKVLYPIERFYCGKRRNDINKAYPRYFFSYQFPQDGTSGNDYLESTAVQADGTIVLGGITDGDWSGANTGGFDIALVALDAYGE